MIELTAEQRRELDRSEPARALDPQTNQTYVLVRADLYELWCARMDDLPGAASLMNEVMADDDAKDPLLDSYQHFRKET